MWEEWRAEIDRSLRDAQQTESRFYERDFRSALRDPERAKAQFRLFTVTTTRTAATRREIPKSWRLRITAARVRPIL
jgi:hypothetical protein